MPEPLPIRWAPASAWAAIATPGRGGAARGDVGVHIAPAPATHVLSIVARGGRHDDLARIAADRLGLALPQAGRFAEGRDAEFVGLAPAQWLAITRTAMPVAIRREIETVAAVTDQSSARAMLDVRGQNALDALAKGFAIDLHPAVFAVGHAATTSVAHMSVQIWQREAARYTIAVPRSFASSLWSWLIGAAAAYGYDVAE